MPIRHSAEAPRLGFGLSFADLADRPGLVRLDYLFLERLAAEDAALHARLLTARADPAALGEKPTSDLIVALGPQVDAFVAVLFGIEADVPTHWRAAPTSWTRCTPASGCSCSARQ